PWIDLDATVAVTAHGLLSAIGAIETALNLLRQRFGVIPEEEFAPSSDRPNARPGWSAACCATLYAASHPARWPSSTS
ncbi:MAG: hypothetical protein JO075_01965, partial [Acidimicrobiia bacterium]|nr:hypothetical protein [Acidimicrobiia bacterium]